GDIDGGQRVQGAQGDIPGGVQGDAVGRRVARPGEAGGGIHHDRPADAVGVRVGVEGDVAAGEHLAAGPEGDVAGAVGVVEVRLDGDRAAGHGVAGLDLRAGLQGEGRPGVQVDGPAVVGDVLDDVHRAGGGDANLAGATVRGGGEARHPGHGAEGQVPGVVE